ncbi:MAG: peptide-methionine (S)-S-oxide reductase MsrA [Acidobacteriota bacterium]
MTLKTRTLLATLAVSFFVAACGAATTDADEPPSPEAIASGEIAQATFAGGCFWCMEPPFDKLDGVVSTISGYTAGEVKNPTYQQVSAGRTGHTEVVQITYDPKKVTFSQLLDVFWRNIDPLAVNFQFCDRGSQYRTGIYAHDDEQLRLAEASRQALADSGRFDQPIATEIEPLDVFYPAEEYHQDYYKKNPIRYKTYRTGCGRDRRLQELWGDAE